MKTPPLTELLPLRAPSLLVEAFEAADAKTARCRARVPAASPFAAADGAVPAYVALEAAAQAAGAHGRLAPHARGERTPPGEGYLVVVREASFPAASFAADEPLTVTVHTEGAAGSLALYRFTVRARAAAIAEGVLGVYVPA